MLEELRGRAPGDHGPARRRGAVDRRRRRRSVSRRARGRAARRAAGGVPRGRARRAAAAGPALRGHPRPVHDRRPARPVRGRLRSRCWPSWSATASSSAASFGPAAREREWCDPRGPAPAAPRLAGRAAQGGRAGRPAARWRGSCPRGRTSTATRRAAPGVDRLREVLVPLQGLALPAEVWERDVLPRRVGAYSPTWMDQLCAGGELVWIGAGALGRNSGRVALYFREDLPMLGPPPFKGTAARTRRRTTRVRARLAAGACFFTDLLVDVDARARGAPGGALGPRLGGRGDQRRVRAAARAAADAGPRPARARTALGRPCGPVREPPARSRRGRVGPGPGPLVADRRRCSATRSIRRRGAARSPSCCSSATAILTREQVRAEGVPGGFSAIYPELSQLETLGHRAARVLRRGTRRRSVRAPRRGRAAPRAGPDEDVTARAGGGRPGAAVRRGAAVAASTEARRAARVAGRVRRAERRRADPVPRARRARAADAGRARDDPRLEPALVALVEQVRAGRIKRLALEKVDGEAAIDSPLGAGAASRSDSRRARAG